MHEHVCVYPVGLKSFNRKYEMSVDTMMDTEVANPLRMLSAYLMTAAMTNPPRACRQRMKTNLYKNMYMSVYTKCISMTL